MNIGVKIRNLRRAKGLNQGDLAKKLNISQPAYAKIEADITKLDIERLKNICEILEVDYSELLDPQNNKNNYYNNNRINNINGFVENINNGIRDQYEKHISQLKEQYDSQIKEMKEEIIFLRNIVNTK